MLNNVQKSTLTPKEEQWTEISNPEILYYYNRNTETSTYNPEPLKIIQVNGSQIVMRDAKGNIYRRNSSHVKWYRKDPNLPPAPQPDEEDNTWNTKHREPSQCRQPTGCEASSRQSTSSWTTQHPRVNIRTREKTPKLLGKLYPKVKNSDTDRTLETERKWTRD